MLPSVEEMSSAGMNRVSETPLEELFFEVSLVSSIFEVEQRFRHFVLEKPNKCLGDHL